MSDLAIKLNNTATNDPCAICGQRTDPGVGPELFLAESYALVCYDCGWNNAPELMAMLESYRAHERAISQRADMQERARASLSPLDYAASIF